MLKIQTHETVNPEDWQGLLADTPPGMEKVFWCIGCAGMFMANTEDKFDVWCAYCITVAQSVVTACGEDADEDRIYLMGFGLAARTFNFAAHPVRRGECDPAPFIKAAQYECKDDVVALLTEGVDRNYVDPAASGVRAGRPPHGGRG